MEPSTLALFWAAAIAIAIVVYVVLDGFDLGVGILFGTTRDPALRNGMMDSISPFWDGNETWLVLVGASLYAAFPVVYAVFLPAFYIPVLLLLFGLIFRGVAFEFRYRGSAHGLWDWGFFLGSTVAAFAQGAAVGAMIHGITVVNGQYAGDRFEWLAPLPVFTGIGLVLGYALLGAGWLVLKSEGKLRDWAWPRVPYLAGAVLLVLVLATVASIAERDRVIGTVFLERSWGLIFPASGLLAMLGIFAGARYRRDGWPFAMTVLFFLASFATLAVLFWPYMIPYSITVGSAAAPEASLSFMFWGAGLFVLPAITIYSIVVYWVFRGKMRKGAEAARHRVVVVGGGFGGLETVNDLAGMPVDITLIDQRNHHIFQPLLYQVATASLASPEIAWPLRMLFRERPEVTTLLATVVGVDSSSRQVLLNGGQSVPYDTLVLATGARHAYFGHDEWARFAPGLKTLEDATTIRRRILLAFEEAEREPDPVVRAALLTFVIVGGGATGVELSGTIAALARRTLAGDFRNIDTQMTRVVLIEAGTRVLAGFPEDLSIYAQRSLERLGVVVELSRAVSKCTADGVAYGDRTLDARTIIWAAGVRASPAAEWLGAPADHAGRLMVGRDLTVPAHPEIFAIGDTVVVAGPNGKPVPGVAPAAKQAGAYVARVIKARLKGLTTVPFVYKDLGSLAQIGKRRAVIDFGWLKLRGPVAWWIWGVVHIYFLIGVGRRLSVAISWLWNDTRNQRGDRLITEGNSNVTERATTSGA